MKTEHTSLTMVSFTILMLLSVSALIFCQVPQANRRPDSINEESGNPDKTLSPYFFVKSDDPGLDQLPLKSTSAEVNIAGVIADVTVAQEYTNEGKHPIEAIYVFPASTRAAVYSMKMTIGTRTIRAKISEREKARKDYEEAKHQGKSASLLEEQRPNVFQMNVANIMPNDHVVVELKYTELLIPEDGVYAFVYPTVVGPRYSNKPEASTRSQEHWVANPYTHEGEKPASTFGLRCSISAGLPISEVKCPSHKTNINFESPAEAVILLDPSEKQGGNRDFILNYRLAGNKVETGLILYPGEKENFFLTMIQPPKLLLPDQIPQREYIFIMDVSGSMQGYPIDISKKLMHDLVGKLKTTDRFNILLFAGGSSLFLKESVAATSENLDKAIAFIDKENGGGGTELLPALKEALALKGTEGYARSFVIATDGYVDVEREAFDLIRKNLDKANFFPFGIGTSVNRYLMEGMAHAGGGMPFVITNPSDATKEAARFRKYVQNPVLSHIKVSFKDFETYDVEPLSVPDVFSERPVLMFGKYRGNPSGTISITGITGAGNFSDHIDVSMVKPLKSNNALRYLWARERIRNYDDFDAIGDENKQQITELGLTYNLLTRFTSFLAIDSEVRNKDGNSTTIKQLLPLPEGVNDAAVGGVGATAYSKSMSNNLSGSNSLNIVSCDAVRKEVVEMEIIDNNMPEPEGHQPILTIVEQMPSFPGGEPAKLTFLANNLHYPELAQESGIRGTVYLRFIVKADGSVTDIKIIRGIGGGCDEEAIRVVKLMPKWVPGKQKGKNVDVLFTMPISFVLSR